MQQFPPIDDSLIHSLACPIDSTALKDRRPEDFEDFGVYSDEYVDLVSTTAISEPVTQATILDEDRGSFLSIDLVVNLAEEVQAIASIDSDFNLDFIAEYSDSELQFLVEGEENEIDTITTTYDADFILGHQLLLAKTQFSANAAVSS